MKKILTSMAAVLLFLSFYGSHARTDEEHAKEIKKMFNTGLTPTK